MKKGISLVALVITIIVLVILSGTVILTVIQNGMIDKSKEAVFKNNVKTFLEDYTNTKLEKQLKDKGGFNESTINASLADNNIKEWIPSITDEFIERIFISNGVFLADKTEYTEEEIVWLEQLGVGFGIAPVIGSTDLWELDETKTKIVKYLGTVTKTDTLIVPNRIKENNTIYTIKEYDAYVPYTNYETNGGLQRPETFVISDNLIVNNDISYGIKKLIIGNNVIFNSGLEGSYDILEVEVGNNVKVEGEFMTYYTSSHLTTTNLKRLIIGDDFYCKSDGNVIDGQDNLEELIIGDNFYYDGTSSCIYSIRNTDFKKLEIGDNFYSGGDALISIWGVKEITIGDNFKAEERSIFSIQDIEKITIGDNASLTINSVSSNDSLKTLNIGKGLTLISPNNVTEGNNFLTGLYANQILENVNIGSFKNVGKNALKGCTLIKKVVLEDGGVISGVSAFENCTGIEEIVLGNVDMSALTTTHKTFTGCTGIKKVTIGKGAGANLKSSMFSSSTTIESVVLEDNCIVPNGMFNACKEITSLNIGQNVTLGTSCFATCTGLTSLYIPKGTKTNIFRPFGNCSNITSVTLEEGMTEIPRGLFMNCAGITNITIPSTVKTIGQQAFYMTGITNITIPSSVTSIGQQAFHSTEITSIKIPGSVKTIGDSAFMHCKSLTDVTISKGVEIIGDYTFSNCQALANITIPSTVKSLGESSFNADMTTSFLIRVANTDIETMVKSNIPSSYTNISIQIDASVDNL